MYYYMYKYLTLKHSHLYMTFYDTSVTNYIVSQKIVPTFILSVTLLNLNDFHTVCLLESV